MDTGNDNNTLHVSRIQRFCLHDGPGIRTTVFLQGCSLTCWWCHNPETHDTGSKQAKDITPSALLAECRRDQIYWEGSQGGITISGGEPLLQAEALHTFLETAHTQSIHTALDTSGMGSLEHIQSLVPFVNLWLWDIKAVSKDTAYEGAGNSLEQCLTNFSWILDNTDSDIWIRIPLISSFNSSEKELEKIASWLKEQSRSPAVQILPGHTLARGKTGTRPKGRIEPCEEEIETAVRILTKAEISTSVSPEEPGS